MTEWLNGPLSDVEAAARLHEMSMSKDPAIASSGRLAKELMPPYSRWLEGELSRGTPTKTIIGAACDHAAGVLAMAAINCVVKGRAPSEGDARTAVAMVAMALQGPFSEAVAATLDKMQGKP